MPVQATPYTSSHYGNLPGYQKLTGAFNETVYDDVDSDGDAAKINAQREANLSEGDERVNAFLIGQGIKDVPVAASDTNYWMLTYAANRFAAVASSRTRGQAQSPSGVPVEQYAVYLKEAEEMLKNYVSNRLFGSTNNGAPPTPDAGTARASCGLCAPFVPLCW